MSGQPGDVPPPSMLSPKKQEPTLPLGPSTTPVPAVVDSKPVAEPIDPIPPTTEIKVANTSTPVSPEHTHTPVEDIPQETPDSEELITHSLADESLSDQQLLNSKSLAEINSEIPPVENKPLNSESIPEDGPHLDTELPDTNRQTQSAIFSEILAAEEQHSSCEKVAENHPQSDRQVLNVEPQTQCGPAGQIPAVEEQDSIDIKAEGLSVSVEDEAQSQLSNAILGNTAGSVKVETRSDAEIAQSEGAAPAEDHKTVESTPEKLPEATVEQAASVIHERVTEETLPPVKADTTATDENKEKICGVSTDEPQNMAAELILSDTTSDINKRDITEESGADIVAPVVSNDVTAENMSATELITSLNPAAKADATDNAGEELQATPANDTELEISSVIEDKNSLEVLEEVGQEAEAKKQTTDKEEEKDLVDIFPVAAPLKKETNVQEKANIENADETKDSEKIIDDKKIVLDKTHEEDNEQVGIDTEVKVGTAEPAEVKSEEGKSLKEEGITKTVDDQKVFRKHDDEACLIGAVSNDAENILMEKEKEVEKESAAAVTVPEEMPKEDVQINKDIQQETKSKAVEGSPVETMASLQKSEENKKSPEVAEAVPQTRKQSLEDSTLENDEQSDKAVVISDLPSVESKQQEANAVEVSVKSVQPVLTSADIIETKPSDKTCKEKDCEGEVEAGLGPTKYQNASEEVVEPSLKDREAETDKKEDESQAVVGSLQEAISVSEACAVCDKDCNTVFDVEVSSTSEKCEASNHVSAVVPSIPLAESEIQSVVSEHDAGLKEESAEEQMDAKTKPVEKHGDDDAVPEVTIMSSKRSSRSLNNFAFLLYFLNWL